MADINPFASTAGSDPGNIVQVSSVAYFTATTATTGEELWKSDGTAAGTVLVKDINPGSGPSSDSQSTPANMNGTLFFNADDGTSGYELWKSDGTAAGTVLLKITVNNWAAPLCLMIALLSGFVHRV